MKKIICYWVLVVSVSLAIGVAVACAQKKAASPTAKAYSPNESQKIKLENAQLKAKLIEMSYAQRAQSLPEFAQFQQSLAAVKAECDKVRDENKWPAEVQCDIMAYPIRFCEQLPCK